jgi:hypothetical protein
VAAQRLPGVHSGVKATLTRGDPLARSMGQYGKGYDPIQAANNAGLPTAADDKHEAGVSAVSRRGMNPRQYSKTNDADPDAASNDSSINYGV